MLDAKLAELKKEEKKAQLAELKKEKEELDLKLRRRCTENLARRFGKNHPRIECMAYVFDSSLCVPKDSIVINWFTRMTA